MFIHKSMLAAISMTTFVLAQRALAQGYSLSVIGTLRSDGTGVSYARGLNDSGVIVGACSADGGGGSHIFRWSIGGGIVDMGRLVSPFDSVALSVNSSGDFCGMGVTQAGGFASGLRYGGTGPMVNLPESGGGGDSYAHGIADNGTVVGWSNFGIGCGSPECSGNPGHAVLWGPSGVSLLPELGGFFSAAFSISPNAQFICGYAAISSGRQRGFRIVSGVATALEPLAGDIDSVANDVNNAGEVVGYSRSASGVSRAVLWIGTAAIDLGMPVGAVGAGASSINMAGEVAGYAVLPGGATRAARFSRSGPAVDLNSLIPAGSEWVLTYADEINALGQIAGEATGSPGTRAFLLTFGCIADFNGDSVVDFFDYLDFVDAFAGNLPASDFNDDGVIDFFDYLDFVDAFSNGC